MPKPIVICIDGTNNEIALPHTNVYRVFQSLDKAQCQALYQPGVATLVDQASLYKRTKFKSWFIDSVTGASMRVGFGNAMSFLIRRWTPGTDIYIFGFSRGAYAARAVAGAIKLFGLPRPEHENLVPYLWQEYTNSALRPGRATEPVFRYGDRVKRDFCHDEEVRIRFLGVFDTVSSLGHIAEFKSLPYTRNNDQIDVVRHAVAIDERRGMFDVNRFEVRGAENDVVQMWFPGYHSDVGGGQVLAESGVGMVAFDWMVEQAVAHGLFVEAGELTRIHMECPASATGPIHDSMDTIYKILEFVPIRKFDIEEGGPKWRAPHFFRARRWEAGDLLHPSVLERMERDPTYRPRHIPSPIKPGS